MRTQNEYLEFAVQLADMAGEIMAECLRAETQHSVKSDGGMVTIADTKVNTEVIKRVQKHYPSHGVLGEEESLAASSEYVWVCDPIDGTKMYAHNIPTSMFSLALVEAGLPVVGLAYNPWTKDMYRAVRGEGAFKNDAPIMVAQQAVGTQGRNAIGNWREYYTKTMQQRLKASQWEVIPQYPLVIKGCLVAEGFLNGQIYSGNGAHDIAALKLIIEEAGGTVTDLEGNEQRYDRVINGAILSNGLIHDELLQLARESEEYADHRD